MAVIVFAAGCGPSAAETKANHERADARKVPQISWRDVNFTDTVQPGDTIVKNFIFHNTGWKPVLIKHALPNRPECTCKVPKHEVLIGEQDTIILTCIFNDFEPKAPIEIIVEHNTPQPEQLLIYVARMFRD